MSSNINNPHDKQKTIKNVIVILIVITGTLLLGVTLGILIDHLPVYPKLSIHTDDNTSIEIVNKSDMRFMTYDIYGEEPHVNKNKEKVFEGIIIDHYRDGVGQLFLKLKEFPNETFIVSPMMQTDMIVGGENWTYNALGQKVPTINGGAVIDYQTAIIHVMWSEAGCLYSLHLSNTSHKEFLSFKEMEKYVKDNFGNYSLKQNPVRIIYHCEDQWNVLGVKIQS